MSATRVVGVSAALAFALAVPLAQAQPQSAQASLEYHRGPGCPDEPAFRARVEARTPGALAPGASRALRVTVDGGEPSRGRLLLTTDGAPVVRDVTGATCDEVASALALIAAVLLEGGAAAEAPIPAPPPAAEPASSPAPPVAPAALSDRTVPPAPPAETSAPDRPVTVRWALGAQGLLGGGIGPSVAAGARVFGEASIDVAANPALRLSLAWYPGTDVETSGGPVHFAQVAARLEVCPVRFATSRVALAPCLFLDAGSLSAGRTEPTSSPEAHLWLAPGALARIAWFFAPSVGVELEGGIAVPLDRYRFFFTPGPFVYQVPNVVGSGGLGLVLRFQ